ncbi:hypothetical protein E2C01_033755 [Portunus trituberculatus]|uniref:Uncharacterized protein n=1 Tax=Portunus trituberculatus TaxID=210409 RepID=A0A5B7F4L4_PORTR|nr:hypothetical protein [Portunus trituberculatus]
MCIINSDLGQISRNKDQGVWRQQAEQRWLDRSAVSVETRDVIAPSLVFVPLTFMRVSSCCGITMLNDGNDDGVDAYDSNCISWLLQEFQYTAFGRA